MIRSIRHIALVLLGTLPLSALAQGQDLSLTQARELALEHNAQAMMAREQTLAAQYRQRATRSLYLPRLSGSAYALYTTSRRGQWQLAPLELPTELSSTLGSLAQAMPQLAPQLMQLSSGIQLPPIDYRISLNNSYYAGLSLRQPIYTGGKISSANRMADIALSMSRVAERREEAEVIMATDEAYWQCVQAQAMYDVAVAYTEAIAETERVVANAVEAGMRTRADILRVEVEKSKAQLQRERASNAVRLAKMNLAQTIGLPLSSDISPSERLPQGERPEPLSPQGDLSARPEYQLLEGQVELRKAEVKLSRSEYLPTLALEGSYAYTRGLRINDQLLLDNGTPTVVVALNIPIFNWGEGRNKVRQARTQLRIAELEKKHLGERMLLEERQASSLYREQNLAVALASSAVVQSQELLRQTRDRYDAGLETTATLLETQTLARQAESEYIVARTQLALSHTRLLRARGQLR